MFGFISHLCVVSRLIIFRQFRFISTLVEDYFSRSGFFFTASMTLLFFASCFESISLVLFCRLNEICDYNLCNPFRRDDLK